MQVALREWYFNSVFFERRFNRPVIGGVDCGRPLDGLRLDPNDELEIQATDTERGLTVRYLTRKRCAVLRAPSAVKHAQFIIMACQATPFFLNLICRARAGDVARGNA